SSFIQSGLNTGTVFSLAAHIGINSLYKANSFRRPTGERFRQLANRSYRLITPVALDNVDRIYSYKRAIGADPYGGMRRKDSQGDTFAYNPNLLRFVPSLEDENA